MSSSEDTKFIVKKAFELLKISKIDTEQYILACNYAILTNINVDDVIEKFVLNPTQDCN